MLCCLGVADQIRCVCVVGVQVKAEAQHAQLAERRIEEVQGKQDMIRQCRHHGEKSFLIISGAYCSVITRTCSRTVIFMRVIHRWLNAAPALCFCRCCQLVW